MEKMKPRSVPKSSLLPCCGANYFTSSGPNNGTTLIPRHVITLIQAFPFITADMEIENASRRRDPTPRRTHNNVQGTPLVHAAVMNDNKDLLRQMLKQHPDLLNSHNEHGNTPLSLAADLGKADMVEFLLKEFPKSKKTKQDKDSSHAVHKACLRGDIGVLKVFFLNSPDSLYAMDRHGQTILHLAAKAHLDKLKDVVSYLVGLPRIGAKLVRIKDETEWTPLDWAQENNNRQVQNILRQYM